MLRHASRGYAFRSCRTLGVKRMKRGAPSPTAPAPESIGAPDNMDSEMRKPFAKANSEMEAVFHEGMTLESQGKLDAVASARIEARLQEISTRLDKDLAEQISQVDARAAPKRWLLPKPLRVPAMAALVFLCAGTLLEVTVGRGFIFSASNGYRAAMPWLFGVLIPVFAVGWFLLERAHHDLRTRYPTWLVRWLVMFPLIVVLSAAMVVVSPLGWAALLGRTIGSSSDRVEVSVISIDPPSRSSRGCVQHARLEFEGARARICLEGRLSGPAPQAGERVSVTGRISRLGLFIDRIDHR